MAFDVISPVSMAIDELPTTTAAIYTVPASTRALVKTIDIANNNLASVTVTVYMVPSGGTAGSDNILIPGVTIPASSVLQWSGIHVLDAAGSIQAVAATTNVSAVISGGEAV